MNEDEEIKIIALKKIFGKNLNSLFIFITKSLLRAVI